MASEGAGYIDFGRCEKCLATVPKIVWHPAYEEHHRGCDWTTHQHFHVTCWRCGYSWVVDALEALRRHRMKETNG